MNIITCTTEASKMYTLISKNIQA